MKSLPNRRIGAPLLGVMLVALLSPPSLQGRPAHKKALADYLGPLVAKKLNDCRACHLPGDDEDEKPHNAFGARLKAIRKELGKAGKSNDLTNCLDAVAEEDSDGDGATNLVELLAGRYPGEPDDRPTPTEIDAAVASKAAHLKLRTGYPWRPFEAVKRPAVPKVKSAGWIRNPLDAFIAAEHEARGLKPNPEAGRPILVRRIYLDLIGLPPTPEELEAALADPSDAWYAKLVDDLLASPRYGERWGRHWMDIWRYSDWYGYNGEIRNSQPHVWRWRDWIVESLNADKSYDRMIVEMLAGDELAPGDPDVVRATGYLVRSFDKLSREKWLQDTVEHSFQGFLGVTIGCARCHDHMFDAISHKEYFQLRAFFEPHQIRIDHVPGDPNLLKNGLARAFDGDLKAPTYFYLRGDPLTPDKSASLPPATPAALGGRLPEITPVKLPTTAYDPENRDFVVLELIAAAERDVVKMKEARTKAETVAAAKKKAALEGAGIDVELAEARLAALTATHRASQLEAAGKSGSEAWKSAAMEATRTQRHQAVMEARKRLFSTQQLKANAGSDAQRAYYAGQEGVQAKMLAAAEAVAQKDPSVAYVKRPVKTYSPTSSGRRLALARWIADAENPLAARVAMNHLWLRHFGQAIVPTVFEFGRNGRAPSHPALLDWLAAEFMERGWSFKAMHRLMVSSATYRLASTPDPASAKIDRDNVYFWRVPLRRMEAEVVRDSVLHAAGKLDVAMGGPELDHNSGLFVPRRSLYFRHAQDQQMEFLKLFDAASTTECYERTTSIAPQQALALANSDLTIKHARILARALAGKHGKEPEAFVKVAFAAVLSRPPSDEERAECALFLKQQTQLYGPPRTPLAVVDEKQPSPDPELRARENLVRILFNHHDFLTIR